MCYRKLILSSYLDAFDEFDRQRNIVNAIYWTSTRHLTWYHERSCFINSNDKNSENNKKLMTYNTHIILKTA